MPGIGNKLKLIAPIIIIACCCLTSTIIMIMYGSKMPVLGDTENKTYLIGADVSYVLCTICCFLIAGFTTYKLLLSPV